MDDRTRRRMAWITFSLLLVLAGIESSLALMRDQIAADMQALRQSLAEVEPVATPASRIPTIGQMVMGFILPFALTFVAIPLETFVNAGRTVLGTVLSLTLRALAFSLRLLGHAARSTGELLVNLYDVLIVVPLWLERQWRGRRIAPTAVESAPAVEPAPALVAAPAATAHESVEEEVLS
jgi:hypothetical protein